MVGSIRSWSVHDVCRQRQKARRRTYPCSRVFPLENQPPPGHCPPGGPKAARQEVNAHRLGLQHGFIYERVELRSGLPKSKTAPIVQKRRPVIKLRKVGSLTWDLDHPNSSLPFQGDGSREIMIHVHDVSILVFEMLYLEFVLYFAYFTFLLIESIADTNS